jgi:hypothetical protein
LSRTDRRTPSRSRRLREVFFNDHTEAELAPRVEQLRPQAWLERVG